MSSALVQENKELATEDKSTDKKEIEHEELENMMNAENKTQEADGDSKTAKTAEETPATVAAKAAALVEEGRETKPKKIPIGGIKMPGFFIRSKSKEKCNKDSENDGADNELLEVVPQVDASCTEKNTKAEEARKSNNRLSLKMTNPFTKRRSQATATNEGEEQKVSNTSTGGEPKEDQPSKGRILLAAIRGPLENVLKRGPRPLDAEKGAARAGLASMETLDDSKDALPLNENKDDTLETVKLDKEKPDEPEVVQLTLRETLIKFKYPIGVTLLFLLVLIIILCCLLAGGPAPPSSAPVRDGKYVEAVTSCGMVEGLLEDSAFAFRGIPYAESPVGPLRFTAASPLNTIDKCWNGTFEAHNASRPCWQSYANGTIDGDEDCLTLDVVTPHVRYDNPLPVVVLIGAESMSGGSTEKLRPSARYARSRDVVFVRPNFRVGVLGFLAAEVLTKSVHPPTSGNYGISDILTALDWIQLNIRHFGGDPEQVTLLGHKSGATLVTLLATSKLAKKKFARVWVASGSAIFPGQPLRDSELANEQYLQQVSCSDVECLRNADAEDLLEAVPDTWRKSSPDLPKNLEEPDRRHQWLVLDGNILKQHPADVWAEENNSSSDQANNGVVNMVIGTTAHESISEKLLLKHAEWTPDLVAKHVRESRLGKMGLAEEALRMYNSTFAGLVTMISDIRTVCPLWTITVQRPGIPFYVVTQTRPDGFADGDSDVEAILGRYESVTPEQRRYVSAMQQLFYYYVWHGKIPQLEEGLGRVLEVGQDVLPRTSYPRCDFWISKDVVPRYARLD